MEQKRYEEVYTELEALVASIEDPARDLSTVGDDVRKAMNLIKWCREYIRTGQSEVEAMMEERQ